MKAIKDCEFRVKIISTDIGHYWWTSNFYGVYGMVSMTNYKYKKSAENHFIKFAKLNGIKNYKFI